MASEFQSFGQVVEILCVLGRVVTLLENIDRIFISLLLDADFGKIAQRVVISGKKCQRLLQRVIRLGDLPGHELQVADLAENPGPVFGFVRWRGLIGHGHQFDRSIKVAQQFAEISGTCESRKVPGTQIQH